MFAETGLRLQIIPPQEEARLSVAGCLNLIDRTDDAALVVDVGGGSTELSWVDLKGAPPTGMPPLRAWLSIPIGVVTLAERFPEGETATEAWFRAMVERVKAEIAAFRRADGLREVFDADRAHLIGTSGAITSLAGLHLNLPRYDRNRVDGIWMTRDDCDAAAGRLLVLNAQERAEQPCIGPDRADLVLAGAAILQAVQELWPCSRVRVADRGLREGILLSLMSERGGRHRRRRRRGPGRIAAGRVRPPNERRTAAPQAHGQAAHRRHRGRPRRARAAEDRLEAHALAAGLAVAPDQRPLRRQGPRPRLPQPRGLQADRTRRQAAPAEARRAGRRPGRGARRLDPGGHRARRDPDRRRRPAAGRSAAAGHHPGDGLHRSGLRPAS